jgi:hypothetical protein
MLTLKRRRKRRFPPLRGRGAILGLFFCCAQCSIPAAVLSTGPVAAIARNSAHACLPHCTSHLTWVKDFVLRRAQNWQAPPEAGSLTLQGIRLVAGAAAGKQIRLLRAPRVCYAEPSRSLRTGYPGG